MRKKLLPLGILFGLLCIVTESWAWDSGASFYAQKSESTPSGSGDVYIYRGGEVDQLKKPTSTDWKAVETGAEANITLSKEDKGDGKIDDSHSALNMYFFAKPRIGYDFVGWYSNKNETGLMSGSTDHYDRDGNKTIWNNNSDATPPGSGYWKEEGIYYLRYVQSVEQGKIAENLYAYAKFKVKPRDIILGGTGFDEVTYTATGFAGSVGKSTQTLSDASGNIELALTYDSEKYTFEGWLWAEGGFTGGDTISKSASYTYPLATTYVAKGMTSSNKVHIWPVVKRKVTPVAEVTHNAVTTPYESWEEAIAAAKATGVSGATITLYKDVADIVSSQEIDRDMTLDLNGHTFAGTANYLFNVTGLGTDFTICNGSVSEGQISFSTSTVQYSYAIGVQKDSKLILQSGKVYANNTMSNGSSRGIEIQSGASLEMTGGSVEAQSLQQAYAIINRGAATISSGDLFAHTTTAATAVAYLNNGTMTEITGGTFRAYATTTTAYGIQQNVNNTMTITNATVRAEAVTSTAYSLARTNGVIVVNGGKYNAVAPSAVAATNVTNKAQITLQGGIYRTNTNLSSCCASGYGCYELNRGETWNEGYRYEVLPTSEARNFRVVADGTSSYFKEFSDVNTFINAGNFTFIEVYLIAPEYTIPAGNYTIPSVATLCVPYDFDCTIKTTDPGHPYVAPGRPSVYRKLILASGAHITNKGEISVSATSQGGQPHGGCVYGKYGQIDMQSGSTITLKNGSNLYCWGYITGTGDIIAESGSTVYEDFQIACWRGGTAGASMVGKSQKVFPLAQYYIQNIEARTIFHAGSYEYASTAVSINNQSTATSVQIIGTTSGFFCLSSGTLTKWYNAVDDRQMYQLEGNASIGSVRISVSVIVSVDIKSEEYVLPLTNNMDFTIKSGTLSCNNDVALLPGASIAIDEGASVSLGSNCRLYVYDKAEWPNNGASAFNYPNASFTKVNYTPSTITTQRTYENMADARMNINGTLEVNKAIYTTAGGADICSTEGTGRVVLKANAGTETETYQATQDGSSISYTAIPITAAKLHNADGSYTTTDGAAANTTYVYCDGTWKKGGCESYTITWKSEDGNTTLETDAGLANGTATEFNGSTPSKAATDQYAYTFYGWTTAANGGGMLYANGATPAVSGNATYYAYFAQTNRSYTVTLNTNGGTINAGDISSYTYGTGATLPTNVTRDGFDFGGWFDNEELSGDAVTSISNNATGDKAYWAKWIPDRVLDVVDWTNNSIKINVSTLKTAAGKYDWKIYVNGTDYTRTSPQYDTKSRTMTISGLSLFPNDNLLIQLKDGTGTVESQHNYMIPQIYNAENATLSGTTSSSVVYVYGGKLTISGSTTLAALYVCPGAEVEVTDGNTLTVGKLVLRTKPWATAAVSGNVSATKIYYTRIAPDGSASYPTSQYYQFGLPYACAINDVRLSDGTTPAYNTTWILKSYNEEKRATNGATGENWDVLASSGTIAAGRGYEMFSSYKYYREYYFPVTPTDNTSVDVTRHRDDKNHSGWNIVCSPLMRVYENESNPVDGLKVSWLLADGSYDQAWPETIWPALPFSYQASATGYLNFSTNEFNQAVYAPRRAAYKEDIQTEWIHLDVKDENGVGDHTSVFVHPDRFEATYQTGIDVAKQSLTASRAILYTTHAYGDMAFAGVADSLLENGIDIAVYSPSAQELTFSLRENKFLHRLEYLWLADNETGARTDLLMNDYTFRADAGTAKGRFVLNGRFKAPQIATGIGNTQTDYNIYAIGNNIAISGVEQGTPIYVFDAVGHMVYTTAATSDEVIVPAPCAGVYMLSVGGQTAKLVINQ